MLAGFSWGFAWLTKTPAMVGLILLPTLLVLVPWKTKNLGYLFSTWVIAFGMYNILRLGPEFQMIAIRNKDYIFPFFEIIKHPFDPLMPHLKDSFAYFWYLSTPVGLLLAVWGLLAGKLSHWKARLILAILWLVPITGQAFIAKTFTARYILYTLPAFIILMSNAIEHIGQHTQKHILVWLAAGLIIVPSFVANYFAVTDPEKMPLPANDRAGYLEEWTAGQGLKEVSDQIIQMSKQGPVMVGSEGFFGTPFSALELYLNNVPNVRITGVGVAVNTVHPNLSNSLKDNQVVLVVNSDRLGIKDPEAVGLKLLGSYPKAVRADGTRQYLLFFELKKT
jgi:4-amino-4-deoxy-L-arabinose transferase-like glycosyltransferase